MTGTALLPSYPPIGDPGSAKTLDDAVDRGWAKRISQRVNSILGGKLNAIAKVTLRASQTTTVVTDTRISGSSGIFLQPTTASAMTAFQAAGGVLVTAQTTGVLTLTHASAVAADQTFNMLIVG